MSECRTEQAAVDGHCLRGGRDRAGSTGWAAQMRARQARRANCQAGKIPVAVMLDDASTMMDFAGPWEVFQDVAMGGGAGYFLYTVAPQMRQYNTSGTMSDGWLRATG